MIRFRWAVLVLWLVAGVARVELSPLAPKESARGELSPAGG